jgi:hypothetical protein
MSTDHQTSAATVSTGRDEHQWRITRGDMTSTRHSQQNRRKTDV